MSTLHNKYPATATPQNAPHPLFQYPKGMSGSVVGVPANHSTETKTVAGTETVQYRDSDDNGGTAGPLDTVLKGQDPNISGTLPTEQLHDWQAGGMSGFQDNDDYCDFTYDVENIAESRLHAGYCYPTGYSLKDGDYDDNGGYNIPTMRGAMEHAMHSDHEFGTDETAPLSDWPAPAENMVGGIPIEPTKRR